VASFVLLVLVLPQVATGIGLGGLASRLLDSGSCGSSGSSGSMGSGSGSSVCGPPTLTANPNAALVDGQSIFVTGSGFSPFAGVGMVECQQGATGPSKCDLSTLLDVGTDGSGSFSTTYDVNRIINLPTKAGNAKSFDCAPNRCFLGAADLSNYAVSASTPIGFDPRSPLAVRGTVAATDTVDKHTGVADIAGTVTCRQADFVYVYVYLQQRYRRFNFTNSGQTSITCLGHTTWSVSIPPGFGLFGVGPANVQVQLQTQVGNSYRTIGIKRNVQLQVAAK